MSSPMLNSEEEILSVIRKLHPFKAAGSDGIPFFIMKCVRSPLGKSIEENCSTLPTVYEQSLKWAKRHRASFAPNEYVLVHFIKVRTKHNSACLFTLPTSTIYPSPSVCVLGVILDKKLSWQPHLQHIKSKLVTQTNILSRLTA